MAVTIETFNSTPGGGTWTVPGGVSSVDYLVVAGGGGAGGSIAGGGGGGGVKTGTIAVTPGAVLTLTVGTGGTAGDKTTKGGNGVDSVFDTVTSTGGGGGGCYTTLVNGNNGGSGGGGATAGGGSAGTAGTGTAGQGNNAGAGSAAINKGGGGGGGANQVGADGTASGGGKGGDGVASAISGSSVTYGGGGGGGGFSGGGTSGGAGGAGGGGAGSGSGAGSNGTANLGGGGGSGDNNAAAGAGGAGVIILSYTIVPFQPRSVLAAIAALAAAVPAQWPYQFLGAQQPYAQRKLPPSEIAVQVNDPPFTHRERTPQQQSIAVQAAQPTTWPYQELGGLQPYTPRQLSPGIIGVPRDDPPFGWPPRQVNMRTAVGQWQPPEWPHVFEGGRQAYEPRRLPPDVTAVPENNPPFGIPPKWLTAVVDAWQPEKWPYVFMGNLQPYQGRQLSPGTPGSSADNPPFGIPNKTILSAIATQWQPPDWPFTFIGGRQAYEPRKLNPRLTSVQIDDPPFSHRERTAAYAALKTPWQPEAWPYAFTGGSQPYTPRKLVPQLTAVPEDNPPFGIPNKTILAEINYAWSQWPNWPYTFIGGRQAYEPRKLAPGTPGSSTDNPPFRHPSKLPGAPAVTYTWQPPAWPYTFMGGRQPYQRGNLPPVISGVIPTPDPRFTIKNIVVRVRYLKGGPGIG